MIPNEIYAIENKTWSTTPPNEKQKLKREKFVKARYSDPEYVGDTSLIRNLQIELAEQIRDILSTIEDGYMTNDEAINEIKSLI